MSSSYPVGGAEIAAYNLAENMASLGHEVTVFSTSVDSRSCVDDRGSMRVCRYRRNFRIEKALFSFEHFFKPLSEEVDVVHLHFTTPPGNLAGWHYARSKRKPLVVTYHGDAVPDYGRLIRRVGLGLTEWLVADRILARANLIICPSDHYISESRFLPRYKEKIVTIPNGINLHELDLPLTKEECRKALSLSTEDRVILYVGALISYKSPDLLIEAFPEIKEKVPQARLLFVGDGPMRLQLERLAATRNVSSEVRFAGSVVGADKARYYKAADVLVLPSTLNTEVFPLVLLEASAAGLPMVVSSLKTFRCLIEDGFNGAVTRTGDAQSLAGAIIALLSRADVRRQMGENARRKVEGYSWDKIARLTERVYETAAQWA